MTDRDQIDWRLTRILQSDPRIWAGSEDPSLNVRLWSRIRREALRETRRRHRRRTAVCILIYVTLLALVGGLLISCVRSARTSDTYVRHCECLCHEGVPIGNYIQP